MGHENLPQIFSIEKCFIQLASHIAMNSLRLKWKIKISSGSSLVEWKSDFECTPNLRGELAVDREKNPYTIYFINDFLAEWTLSTDTEVENLRY